MPSEEERRGVNLLGVAWKQRWIVLACSLLGIGIAVYMYVKATPIYASSSLVYVQESAPAIVSDPLGNVSRGTGYLYTQAQLIGSTAILREALAKPGVSETKLLKGASNPVAVLHGSIAAEPEKQGDLITVSMQAENPKDASTIVNAVVEAYIDYQTTKHKSTAVEVLKILQKEANRYETALTDLQAQMLKLKRDNPDLAFTTSKGSIALSRLAELSDALSAVQLRIIDMKTAEAQAKEYGDDPAKMQRLINDFGIGGSAAPPSVDPQTYAKYRETLDDLDDMSANLGPRHTRVVEAERRVERLKDRLDSSTKASAAEYRDLLEQSKSAAEARVTQIQAAMSEARGSAIELNEVQNQLEQLQQEATRAERSLDLIDSRIKDVNLTEDAGSLTVSVFEPAKPELAPVSPVRSKYLGVGLVGGLLTGIGLAVLRDRLDHRLRSADEISAALGLPILGVVPHIIGRVSVPERGQQVQVKPRSNVAEAYRTVRTALNFALVEAGNARTLLITSPSAGEGKSTSASNLAIALAQSGRNVLLIDADARRPSQHRIFGIEEGRGLSSVLAGEASADELTLQTGIANLSVLPCGEIPHNPAELLDRPALGELLEELAQKYDHVIIDSPPLIPVTDARIIAGVCDAVVLVLRAERSTRRHAEHARDALGSVGARVLGVLVNDVPRGGGGYGYDYYGVGRYGYAARANGNGHAALPGGSVVVTAGRPVPLKAVAAKRSPRSDEPSDPAGASADSVGDEPAEASPAGTRKSAGRGEVGGAARGGRG